MTESPLKALPDDLTTLLAPGKLFMFTRTNCPFCDLAKEYLHEMNVPFEYIVCDTLGITDEHKEQLFQLTGAKSYPRIFVGKHSIGGFDDLRKSDDDGKLAQILQSEGIAYNKNWWFNPLETNKPTETTQQTETTKAFEPVPQKAQTAQQTTQNEREGPLGKELDIKQLPADLSSLLNPGKVFIFTRTNCPFCDLAKEYLQEKNVHYEYVVCDTLGITDEQKEQLFQLTGAKSYPRIFVGKNSVGGFDDLKSKDDKGHLEKLFDQEGVSYKKDWFTSQV